MKKTVFKYIGLEVLLLIALILCGIIVMKIFNVVLNLEFENIGATGFIAGLCAWFILLIGWGIKAVKTKRNKLVRSCRGDCI